MLKQLWNDELGVIISAELVLVLTIVILAMVVGLHTVARSVVLELGDLASAFGTINQGFQYQGLGSSHAAIEGSGFTDKQDACDCEQPTSQVPLIKTQIGANPENTP